MRLFSHLTPMFMTNSRSFSILARAIFFLLVACVMPLLSSCSGGGRDFGDPYLTEYIGPDGTIQYADGRQREKAPRHQGDLYQWNGQGLTGEPRVVIDLTHQRAEIYIGGQPAGWTVVATGKEGHGTPAGSYRIQEKIVDKRSNLYGQIVDGYGNVIVPDADSRTDRPPSGGAFVGAPMPYWMRLTSSGIGMHAGPIPQPGQPASHGCIRMPYEMAVRVHNLVRVGTPVQIVR